MPELTDFVITPTEISVTFDTTNSSGSSPLDYFLLYGITDPPTEVNTSGTGLDYIYQYDLTGLTPETTYYFASAASNIVGIVSSVVNYYSTIAE